MEMCLGLVLTMVAAKATTKWLIALCSPQRPCSQAVMTVRDADTVSVIKKTPLVETKVVVRAKVGTHKSGRSCLELRGEDND